MNEESTMLEERLCRIERRQAMLYRAVKVISAAFHWAGKGDRARQIDLAVRGWE